MGTAEVMEYSKVVSVIKLEGAFVAVTDGGDKFKLNRDPSTGHYVVAEKIK